MRSPLLAAVLGLIFSGLGQIYNGQIVKGVVFVVVQLINAALMTVLVGFVLMPIIGSWAMSPGTKHALHQILIFSWRDLESQHPIDPVPLFSL